MNEQIRNLQKKPRNEIINDDIKEIARILELLDENSRNLAKTYMSALADRQQIKKVSI